MASPPGSCASRPLARPLRTSALRLIIESKWAARKHTSAQSPQPPATLRRSTEFGLPPGETPVVHLGPLARRFLPVLRNRLRLYAWIAALSMLIAAFAPTVSRALASGSAAQLAGDICVASGSRAVAPTKDRGPGLDEEGDSRSGAIDDCPYCTLHASDQALLPAASVFRLTLADGRSPQISSQATPRPSSVWPSSRPRAPPDHA